MSGTFLEAIIICGNSSETVLVKHTNEMVPQWYVPFCTAFTLTGLWDYILSMFDLSWLVFFNHSL